jgi:hypothetical protein
MELELTAKRPKWKESRIVFGVLAAIAVIVIIWLLSTPEGGVKLGNEMDRYALKYIEKHNLLNHTEKLIAYYDETISMNGSEAAILTTERILYHKDGRTTSIDLRDAVDVQHRYHSLIGDIIEVRSKLGERIRIEIAPLNAGKSFYNALMDVWRAPGARQ